MPSWSTAVSVNPSSAQIHRLQVWFGISSAAVVVTLLVHAAAFIADPVSKAPWRPVLAASVFAVLITAGVIRSKLGQARQLKDFVLTIDTDGLHWTGDRPGNREWAQIGHVFISGGKGQERLWVVAPNRWTPNPSRSAFTSGVMRVLGGERLLLDVPVNKLSHPAAEITRVIQEHQTPGAGHDEFRS